MQTLRAGEGFPLIQEALDVFRKGNYLRQVSFCLTYVGREHRRKGEFDRALEALQQKLDISESAADPKEVAFAKADVAMVFAKQERYIEALARYDESNEIDRANEYWVGLTYNQMNRASILWQLGRYDEARTSLDEASALAVKGKSGLKAVLAEIQMIRAQMALSQRQFIEAKRLSSQAIEQAGTFFPDIAIGARITHGTAQAFSGATRDARRTCEEAFKMAKDTNEESLISDAMWALAQAMFANGDFEEALNYALNVQERLARSGEQESEWRAWLLAGQCTIQMKDPALGRERLTRANNSRSKLQEQWGAEAFGHYQARPDIQFSLKQLSEALSADP
jgi:tetratricopeptide (TPR) repeat protein